MAKYIPPHKIPYILNPKTLDLEKYKSNRPTQKTRLQNKAFNIFVKYDINDIKNEQLKTYKHYKKALKQFEEKNSNKSFQLYECMEDIVELIKDNPLFSNNGQLIKKEPSNFILLNVTNQIHKIINSKKGGYKNKIITTKFTKKNSEYLKSEYQRILQIYGNDIKSLGKIFHILVKIREGLISNDPFKRRIELQKNNFNFYVSRMGILFKNLYKNSHLFDINYFNKLISTNMNGGATQKRLPIFESFTDNKTLNILFKNIANKNDYDMTTIKNSLTLSNILYALQKIDNSTEDIDLYFRFYLELFFIYMYSIKKSGIDILHELININKLNNQEQQTDEITLNNILSNIEGDISKEELFYRLYNSIIWGMVKNNYDYFDKTIFTGGGNTNLLEYKLFVPITTSLNEGKKYMLGQYQGKDMIKNLYTKSKNISDNYRLLKSIKYDFFDIWNMKFNKYYCMSSTYLASIFFGSLIIGKETIPSVYMNPKLSSELFTKYKLIGILKLNSVKNYDRRMSKPYSKLTFIFKSHNLERHDMSKYDEYLYVNDKGDIEDPLLFSKKKKVTHKEFITYTKYLSCYYYEYTNNKKKN